MQMRRTGRNQQECWHYWYSIQWTDSPCKRTSELENNGYAILPGKDLQEFKLVIASLDVPEINFGNINKTPQLSIFDFRAFLNLAILIIHQKTGGGTKYINQRDEELLVYRRKLP